MEEYINLTAILNGGQVNVYNNANGMIVKTILMSNSSNEMKQVNLTLDGVMLTFAVEASKHLIVSTPIFTKSILASGTSVHLHITGLQTGVI